MECEHVPVFKTEGKELVSLPNILWEISISILDNRFGENVIKNTES